MNRLSSKKRVLPVFLILFLLAAIFLAVILFSTSKAKINRRLHEFAKYVDNRIFSLESQDRIEYFLTDDTITMTSSYGTDELRILFGKRGPNQLPDIKSIAVGSVTLYNGGSDSIAMPYTVAAVENINGDNISQHYFTGGNHNYNNTGDSSGSATGRNISLKFYADGKLLGSGDSGRCNQIQIVFTNRIQAYNTRRYDGSGREVLEESRSIDFDGSTLHLRGSVLPLEDVEMELYYGCGLTIARGWPTVQYIGGENRSKFNFSQHLRSENTKPNGIRCTGEHDQVELMIDRSIDLGAEPMIDNSTSGAFCNSSKVYFCLIKDSLLSAGDEYFFDVSYRFTPV